MRTRTKRATLVLGALALTMAAGCRQTTRLEVRTFDVEHLTFDEVFPLLIPYVYQNRPDAPGILSGSDATVTVRETADNLDQIARVLAEHDVARPDVRLAFQLIEADGFTDTDPRIASIVGELREVFQFGGYRLAGEAVVAATDASEVRQQLRATDGVYEITAEVRWLTAGTIRLGEVTLWSDPNHVVLQTTVNVRPGQTLILGSTPREGSTATLLLTVRADEVS